MINDFCEDIGVARKGNENYTSAKKLESFARKELDANAPRVFTVLEPVVVNIVNFDEIENKEIQAPLFPSDPSKGSRTYRLTQQVYIEREDFSETKKAGFFGIMPEQVVCLRYGPFVLMESVEKDAAGNVIKVNVKCQKNYDKKVKGVIHWVSVDHSTECIVYEYDVLLTVEDCVTTGKKEGKDWLEYFNHKSCVPHPHARIWNQLNDVKPYDRFQFERLGYFCVDEEARSEKNGGKIVFNSIVALKESAEKKKGTN
jgi:glutaminyl-tRNA synthetase